MTLSWCVRFSYYHQQR